MPTPYSIDPRQHREFIGGGGDMWGRIGRLQLAFMIAQGLRPAHVFLDIACGSLRGGIHFIPYLDAGHYLGIEREAVLVERGVAVELGQAAAAAKQPEFVISGSFEFERFSRRPDFALAQSLFTHLTPDDIRLCLRRLRDWSPRTIFYATFFERTERNRNKINPSESHPNLGFVYTREELESFGRSAGWTPDCIGDWGHPRGQQMMAFR